MTSVRVRYLKVLRLLLIGGELTNELYRQRFGVSHATAKRDMQLMRRHLPVRTRTEAHGAYAMSLDVSR